MLGCEKLCDISSWCTMFAIKGTQCRMYSNKGTRIIKHGYARGFRCFEKPAATPPPTPPPPRRPPPPADSAAARLAPPGYAYVGEGRCRVVDNGNFNAGSIRSPSGRLAYCKSVCDKKADCVAMSMSPKKVTCHYYTLFRGRSGFVSDPMASLKRFFLPGYACFAKKGLPRRR